VIGGGPLPRAAREGSRTALLHQARHPYDLAVGWQILSDPVLQTPLPRASGSERRRRGAGEGPIVYFTATPGVASIRRTTMRVRSISSGMRGAIFSFQWSVW
jgi:hypothetical protein